MKTVALTITMLGLLCIIVAALTAFGVIPAVVGEVAVLGQTNTNAAFWGGLAGLLFLGGISIGVYTIREL